MLIDPENYFAEFAFCGNTFAAAIQSCLLLKSQDECEPMIPVENLHAIATVTLSSCPKMKPARYLNESSGAPRSEQLRKGY